jgi:hypothetical protein
MNPFKAKSKKEAEAAAAESAPMTKLEERREELRSKFTELQFDLGGAAYEMAARDYFRLDVLAKMAARLQLVDAELAEIERAARLEKAGASGTCAGCGSLHAQGAVYCWRCGRNLHETTQAVVSPLASVPSAVEPVDSVAPETNGSHTDIYAFEAGGQAQASGMNEPGQVDGTPDPLTDPIPPGQFDQDVVDFDPGPRNHPNLGPEPGGEEGRGPGYPTV